MTNDELQSKMISFLRFPLIAGVVLAHSYVIPAVADADMGGNSFPVFDQVRNLFSQVIGNIFVPLFFFISGFLFFYRTTWGQEVYKRKLKSRARTLLVPYLFWNGIVLLFTFMIALPLFSSFFPHARELHLSVPDIFREFWAVRLGNDENEVLYPIAYQFWFIRDLMVVVALTPLIYLYVRYTSWIGIVLLGFCWYMALETGIPGFSVLSLFFFSAGAYFSINNRNLVLDFKPLFLLVAIIYPLLVIADLYTIQSFSNRPPVYVEWIHRAGILVGIILIVNLVAHALKQGHIKSSAFLASASFFVFAFHEPVFLNNFRKVLYRFFPPVNEFWLIVFYFITPAFVVLISLAVYRILKKYLPAFTNIITGGR